MSGIYLAELGQTPLVHNDLEQSMGQVKPEGGQSQNEWYPLVIAMVASVQAHALVIVSNSRKGHHVGMFWVKVFLNCVSSSHPAVFVHHFLGQTIHVAVNGISIELKIH